jgi:hypothetical protein
VEIDLVLNELSLQNPASDKPTARQWMSNFIQTIKAVKSQGVKVYLRTKYDFYRTILASDYPMGSWLNDQEVGKEERIFIKTLATGSPFSENLNIFQPEVQDIENNQGSSEFYYQQAVTVGLAITYLLDTLAISFISDECWNISRLTISYLELPENEEEVNKILEIRHASLDIHVQDHSEWIQERIRTGVIDGEDIWERRKELFPSLEFCENVSKQIQSLDYGTPMLRQVEKKLFELENYCKTWTNGAFDLDILPSKATPESESRLKDLKEKLTFECPDGKKRIFSLHLRMTGAGAWRLHFSTELGAGKIIIGYIGKKIE